MSHTIDVTVNGRNITVSPTRLFLKEGGTDWEVVWQPGSGVTITGFHFMGASPPITPAQEMGKAAWKGTFNKNARQGVYKYTIKIQGQKDLDPEIEYGPDTDSPIGEY